MTTSPEAGETADGDAFVLSEQGALFVAFIEAGFDADTATLLADYARAHPNRLLEDCKPSAARAWLAALQSEQGR